MLILLFLNIVIILGSKLICDFIFGLINRRCLLWWIFKVLLNLLLFNVCVNLWIILIWFLILLIMILIFVVLILNRW